MGVSVSGDCSMVSEWRVARKSFAQVSSRTVEQDSGSQQDCHRKYHDDICHMFLL